MKQAQFKKVFTNGSRVRGKGLTVVFAKNAAGPANVGIAVPKAVIGLSTRRNRIKRLLREAYRLNKAKIKPGLDIVIIAGRPFSSFREAEEAFLSILKKAGLLRE